MSELNDRRFQGDTILKTLTRVLSFNFVEKNEYDITLRSLVTRDYYDSTERTIDRINSAVDGLDSRISKIEESVENITNGIKDINEAMKAKVGTTEFAKIESKFNSYATLDKLQQIDGKFVKYCKNEYVFELKNRINNMQEYVSQLATVKLLNEKIEKSNQQIYEELENFISIKNVNELFRISNDRLEEIKYDIKNQLKQIMSIQENLKAHSELIK